MRKAVFGFCVFAFSCAQADVLGVTDTALLAKSVKQLGVLYKQLETMKKSYTTATEQYNATQALLSKSEDQLKAMKDLVAKNSGHSGFGSLNNLQSDLRNQQWSANTWADSLKGASGSNHALYKSLVKSHQKNHAVVAVDEFKKGGRGKAVLDYEQAVAVNQAASVQSEYAFNDINKSLKRIHDLSLEIDKAETTKAAVDLNSRLLTELAYLQTQNLKSQSINNQQLAQKQALDISERGTTSQLLSFDDDY